MIGTVLGSRYEIIEKIDAGGMAYVFKALCKKTNHYVAIKVLRENFADSQEYVNRFKKEAQAAFALDHEHIVNVADVGYDQGVYYMVMEYVEGPTLKTLIEEKQIIDERQAIEYAIQLCGAMSAAHRKGIVHRDIKPHNILIDNTNQVKVTDFGIAKSISAKDEDENQAIGSVYYISPEQAKGDRVDGRSDIYSLGIVLYEMVTGQLPYNGDKTIAIALKHINEQITSPKRINERLSDSINNIILKATSKDKKDRYRSMKEFQNDLVQALLNKDGEFVDISVPRSVSTPKKSFKNQIWKVAILLVLASFIIGVIVISVDAFQLKKESLLSVPDSLGEALPDAVKTIRSTGLGVELTYENSETVEEGRVLKQSPEPGSEITKDEMVNLTISQGPVDLEMPDVRGMSELEARDIIEQMGLRINEIVYEQREDIEPDTVLSQIPEAGNVIIDDDVVTLALSQEIQPNTISIPELEESPIEKAISLLADVELFNCFVYEEESDFEEGVVIRQSIEVGSQIPLDSELDLTISKYKRKGYVYNFREQIEIPEKESKVRIVVRDKVADTEVNFITYELNDADAGVLLIEKEIECMSGGIKQLVIYINGIETYSYDIELTERGEFGKR